jgi:hypothetical protein
MENKYIERSWKEGTKTKTFCIFLQLEECIKNRPSSFLHTRTPKYYEASMKQDAELRNKMWIGFTN